MVFFFWFTLLAFVQTFELLKFEESKNMFFEFWCYFLFFFFCFSLINSKIVWYELEIRTTPKTFITIFSFVSCDGILESNREIIILLRNVNFKCARTMLFIVVIRLKNKYIFIVEFQNGHQPSLYLIIIFLIFG